MFHFERGSSVSLTPGSIISSGSAPDLTALRVPSLQLCATPSVGSEYPWIRRGTPAYRRARQYVSETLGPFAERLCSRFGRTVPGGRVVHLQGSHYRFFTKPEKTVQALQRYLK